MEWVITLFVLGAGLAGYVIGRSNTDGAKQSRKLNAELKKTREELAEYRSHVDQHFTRTAELINTMTSSYRAIYEHLAEGAQSLCGSAAMKLEAMGPPAESLLTVSGEKDPGGQPEESVESTPEPAAEAGNEEEKTALPAEEEVTQWPFSQAAEERGSEERVH